MSRYKCWNCKQDHGTDNVVAVCVHCFSESERELKELGTKAEERDRACKDQGKLATRLHETRQALEVAERKLKETQDVLHTVEASERVRDAQNLAALEDTCAGLKAERDEARRLLADATEGYVVVPCCCGTKHSTWPEWGDCNTARLEAKLRESEAGAAAGVMWARELRAALINHSCDPERQKSEVNWHELAFRYGANAERLSSTSGKSLLARVELLERVAAILREPWESGTRVTNCVAHSGMKWELRPADCSLCKTDFLNHVEYAYAVNKFLNDRNDRALAALDALEGEKNG